MATKICFTKVWDKLERSVLKDWSLPEWCIRMYKTNWRYDYVKNRLVFKLKNNINNLSISYHSTERIKERIKWSSRIDKWFRVKRDILRWIEWFVVYQPDSKSIRIQGKYWIYVVSFSMILITVLPNESISVDKLS